MVAEAVETPVLRERPFPTDPERDQAETPPPPTAFLTEAGHGRAEAGVLAFLLLSALVAEAGLF